MTTLSKLDRFQFVFKNTTERAYSGWQLQSTVLTAMTVAVVHSITAVGVVTFLSKLVTAANDPY